MKINAILAMDQHCGIGKNNAIPWNFKQDMDFFRRTTTGHTVMMGMKTFQSLGCKPLKNRINVVITRQPALTDNSLTSTVFYTCPRTAVAQLRATGTPELFVIGGAQLYAHFFKDAGVDRLYLTRIHAAFDCDTTVSLPDQSFYSIHQLQTISSEAGLTAGIECWEKVMHDAVS